MAITHLMFGREYAAAIENKQVMVQEAERAKYIVEFDEHQRQVRSRAALEFDRSSRHAAQARIIRAEGEAEAAELISAALKSSGTGVIEVRRLDVR